MNTKIIDELKKEYPEHQSEVQLLLKYIDKLENGCPDKRAEYMEQAQLHLNTLYTVKPAPILIEVQVILNTYRNMYNITDPREVVNSEGFVQ